MSELLTNPFIIAAGSTTLFLIIGAVHEIIQDDEVEENGDIDWYEDIDYEEEPPLIELNQLDDEECAI